MVALATLVTAVSLAVPSWFLTSARGTGGPDVDPLPQAHAHNDYQHERPLFDTLEHGFTSVEADVWVVNGELLVAHDVAQAQPGRTLESLYLDPLQRRVAANGGSVYPDWRGSFQLLIDVKTEAETRTSRCTSNCVSTRA